MKNTRRRILIALGALCALGGTACSDSASYPDSVFVIRGRAMSGAHNRTALANGYVGLVKPSSTGWKAHTFGTTSKVPNKTVTDSDGYFTLTVPSSDITSITAYGYYLAASDSGGTQTLISEIPSDIVEASAQLAIDINVTTTTQAFMICPGGRYPPPSGSYCYHDPNQASTTKTSMNVVIDAQLGILTSLEPSGTAWASYMTTFLATGTALAQLKQIAAGAGFDTGTFTSGVISVAETIPAVTVPVYGTDNNDPDAETSTSTTSCRCSYGGNDCSGGKGTSYCRELWDGFGSCVCSTYP
jgi:hypothetical protein